MDTAKAQVVDLEEFRGRRQPQATVLPFDAPLRPPLTAWPTGARPPLTARQQAHRRRMLEHLANGG